MEWHPDELENGDGLVTVAPLLYRRRHPRPRETRATIKRTRELSMMDVLMIAIALSLFALAIAYAYAIENG
jgi:hypothetical protein